MIIRILSCIAQAYPLCILMCTDQQLYNARQSAVFSQRGVVSRAQSQVTDQTDHGLDEGPAAGRVQQLDQHGQPIVQPHRVLGHLSLRVPRSQVTQSTDLKQIQHKSLH